MIKKAHLKKLIAFGLTLVLLTGCGSQGTKGMAVFSNQNKNSKKNSMLAEYVADYEVPITYPSIMTDINGYDEYGDKEAVIRAKSLPAVYEIKDTKTRETVYRGAVHRKDTEETGEYKTGIIDFSKFTDKGSYYIETEILGVSKNFEIKEDLYKEILEKAYKGLRSLRCENCHFKTVRFENNPNKYLDVDGGWHTDADGGKDVVEGCLAVMDICTAFEYYGASFEDDFMSEDSKNNIPDILDEAIYEVEWLLKMQNSETGGVYTSVSLQNVSGKDEKQMVVGGETTRATAYFCACMSKFSMTIKKYDASLSNKALQAAGIAWKCLEANKEIVTEEQRYRAAVEMYRATGQDVYKTATLSYLEGHAGEEYDTRASLDGAITYIATSRATDVTIASNLMTAFRDRMEIKADASDSSSFMVESEEFTATELLRTGFEFIIIDYILSNGDYKHIEENILHFLYGRNKESKDYTDELILPDDYVKLMALAARLSSTGYKY